MRKICICLLLAAGLGHAQPAIPVTGYGEVGTTYGTPWITLVLDGANIHIRIFQAACTEGNQCRITNQTFYVLGVRSTSALIDIVDPRPLVKIGVVITYLKFKLTLGPLQTIPEGPGRLPDFRRKITLS
jgi:hypothetical protein